MGFALTSGEAPLHFSRSKNVMHVVELTDMLDKKVYQLSGGEQQRIAIIKLILQGSRIILADEPTSGLDKENESIVMKLLKELNEDGITIIMVTHNMNLLDCFSRVINVENFR